MYRMTKLVNLSSDPLDPDFEAEATSVPVESLEEAVRITGANLAMPTLDDTGAVEHWLLVPKIDEGTAFPHGWALQPVRRERGDRHDVDHQIRKMMKKGE